MDVVLDSHQAAVANFVLGEIRRQKMMIEQFR
jgi:hypothetical protein